MDYNKDMSLPEMQPSSNDRHAADRLDDIDTVFCKLNIERLMEEAKVLGKLVVIDANQVEVVANVTTDEPYDSEDEIQPIRTDEFVRFLSVKESNFLLYKVSHDTFVKDAARLTRQLRREFNLCFHGKNEDYLRLKPQFSHYNVNMQQVDYASEGFNTLYNEGYPLSEEQEDMLILSEDDVMQIKSYQLGEIRELAVRALASVRADLTS